MMKSKLLNSMLLAALAAPGVAMAADAPAAIATPAAPTLSAILDASGISVTGDLDFSYSSLSGTGQFQGTTTNDRVFDYAHNSFTMQAMDLTIAKQPAEGYGGVAELTLGKDASTIASSGTNMANQTFDITQAFVQYATGAWTTIAGKYATLAGQEVIKSSGNTNFSRGILFGYAIPFTHTGFRTTYKISDAVSLMGGVNNGWDEASDLHPNKNVELGAMLNPTKSIVLNVMDHYGVEQVAFGTAGTQGKRNLLDVVFNYIVSDSLNFALNYDGGSQDNAPLASGSTGSAKWSGVAAYANYQINDLWRLSARAETFNDKDGYRTSFAGGQKWKEATLTVGYAPNKNVELRGEVRHDTSDKASFAYSDGIARKAQSSLGLEAIYKF
jgi:Putative beta-barrel porin-2, OmpL-like. bbp2